MRYLRLTRTALGGGGGTASYHDGIGLDFTKGLYYRKPTGGVVSQGALTSLFTFTGGNQSMYMGGGGLLVQSATNTPRIEYSPSGSGILGLLMEASRTNLCLQSQDAATSWATNNVTISTNAVAAPDGTTTADRLVETAATGQHNIAQGITKAASSLTYTLSTFVKVSDRTYFSLRLGSDTGGTNSFYVVYDLAAGTVGSNGSTGAGYTYASAGIQSYPNGWYRVWVTGSTDTGTTVAPMLHCKSDSTTSLSYTGTTSNGIYVWGMQLELGAFPSSYIPTTTVSVARTADSCIRTLGTEFSATAGTVVIQGRASGGQDASNAQTVFDFNDATGSNRITILRVSASNTARFTMLTGGVQQGPLDGTFTSSTAYKAAIAFAANDLAYSFNGAAATTDATATLPTVTRLEIGSGTNGGVQGNCHIRTFDYYNTRLPNTFLVSAST